MRFHAHLQRFQAFDKHPGIEGTHGHACRAQITVHRLHDGFFTEHGATQHPALTINIFGRRVNHDICAQFEWLLQGGCTEAVVHRQQCTCGMGDLGQLGYIADFGQRIRRCFGKKQFGVGLYGSLPGSGIGQ